MILFKKTCFLINFNCVNVNISCTFVFEGPPLQQGLPFPFQQQNNSCKQVLSSERGNKFNQITLNRSVGILIVPLWEITRYFQLFNKMFEIIYGTCF